MTKVTLRRATAVDLPHMVAIEIEAAKRFPLSVLPASVGRSGSPLELQEALAAGLAWVAEADKCLIVGFLAAQAIDTSLHIIEMDVHPSHGRQGIGATLLRHAVNHCKSLGLREATLTTFRSVPWNGPFYTKHGFRPLEGGPEFPHLTQALAREARRGLQDRVAMLRNVA